MQHLLNDASDVIFSMKMRRTHPAKIVLHADGLGVPSPETVRQRAWEISKINGHEHVTDEDWMQAKREVHGGIAASSDGDDEMIESASERDMVATDCGHRVQKIFDDTENAIEELVAEGLDEAAHDQMLQAAMQDDEDLSGQE